MDRESLERLLAEYWGELTADQRYQDPDSPGILHLEGAPTFYDFLVARGFSRHQLSAHGIGRDIEA